MAENGVSRVYLGIHVDFDDLVGQEVGQSIAQAVSSESEVASNVGDPGNDGLGAGGRADQVFFRMAVSTFLNHFVFSSYVLQCFWHLTTEQVNGVLHDEPFIGNKIRP